MFGQQQQQPQGGFLNNFGQAQKPGGLFGAPQPQTGGFGQQNTFGQPPQGTSGGMFGQQTQPQTGLGGFSQAAQAATGGGFGAGFGLNANTQTPFGAQQPQAQGGFGQQNQNFNKPTTGSFFGNTQLSQNTSPLNQQFGQTQQNTFGQPLQGGLNTPVGQWATPAQNAFGQQPQAQPQQPSNFFQQQQNQATGLFGSTGFNQAQPIQTNLMNPGQKSLYGDPNATPQFLTSAGKPFQPFLIADAAEPAGQNKIKDLVFNSIQSQPMFDRITPQMLKLIDYGMSKGSQIQSYEFTASQEFKQNPNAYTLINQIQNLSSTSTTKQNTVQTTLPFGQTGQGGFQNQNQTQQFPQQTTGGLTGGLFAQQQKPAGFFGAQNQSPGQTGGLFVQQQQNTGGLFGQTTPFQTQIPQQNQPVTQGFLQQNQPTTGGLFDNKPQGGGLFNQPQTQLGQGGLFSQPPQTPAFAAQTQVPIAQPQSTPQTIGGLYGQQVQQPTTGGLFSGGLGNNGSGGGLFNKTPLLGTNQQQATVGLFNQQAPGGTFTTQAPAQTGLFAQKPGETGGLFSSLPQQTPQIGGLFSAPVQPNQQNFFNAQQPALFNQNLQQNQQQNQNPQFQTQGFDLYNSKDPFGFENSFLTQPSGLEQIQNEIEELKKKVFSQQETKKYESQDLPQISQAPMIPFNYHSSINQEAERQRMRYEQKQQMIYQRTSKPSTRPIFQESLYIDPCPAPKPDLSTRQTITQQKKPDTFKISIKFNHERQIYCFEFHIHSSRDVQDIRSKVAAWMRIEFSYDQPESDLILLKQGDILQDISLKDAGITQDVKLEVRCKYLQQECQLVVDNPTQVVRPIDVPKPPKIGYKCEPDYEKLKNMSLRELQQVENFTVQNEFGSVQFIGLTDITGVDLADVVDIVKGSVEVYDDERHKNTKPIVGEKLNKPAVITLYNILPKVNQSASAKEQQLIKILKKMGDTEHLCYDHDKHFWQFKVLHFTKYADKDDEDMESEEQAESENKLENLPSPVAAPSPSQISQIAASASDSVVMIEEKYEKSFVTRPEKVRKTFQSIPSKPIMVELPQIFKDSIKPYKQIPSTLQKIQQRQEEFSKLAPSRCQRPSDKDTADYLATLGIKKANLSKCSLAQRTTIRPNFHPNGQGIIFVKNNKIVVVKTPVVTSVDLGPILKKQSEEPIHQKMENLNIDYLMGDTVQADYFEDQWFRNLFDQQLKENQLFQNSKGEITISKVYQFLHDLAKIHCNKDQLQDFVTICMLNAVYGNPNLLLNQLHTSYAGPSSINHACENFKYLQGNDIEIMKKRRNAVVELLRFQCSKKYPVTDRGHSDESIYKQCYQLLSVGDVKTAVKLLTTNKKMRLALIISQSVSNQQCAERFKCMESENLSPAFLQIKNLVCGNDDQLSNWDQQLLCDLLWKECPTRRLEDIIKSRLNRFQNVHDTQWSLLKMFAGVQSAELSLSDERNLQLKWVIELVLRSIWYLQKSQTQIQDEEFCDTSSKLFYQLLASYNYTQAYFVSSVIPQGQVRKQLLFKLFTIAQDFKVDGKVEATFQRAANAVRLQSHNQTSQAFRQWIELNNPNQANLLFYQNILPLYIYHEVSMESISSLVLKQYKILPQHFIDKCMKELKQFDNQIEGWSWTTNVFRRARQLKRALMQREIQNNIALQEAIGIRRDCKFNDQVTNFVLCELSSMETILFTQDAKLARHANLSGDGCKDFVQRNAIQVSIAGMMAQQK